MLFRNLSGLTVILIALIHVVPFRTCFRDASKDMEVPGFIYIGSYRYTKNLGAFSDADFYYYYLSLGLASWNVATTDCKARFRSDGKKAGLLWFNTPEELVYVAEMLANRFPGLIGYWTSGIYVKSRGKWVWTTTKEDVPSWVPWKDEAPPNDTDSSSRLVLSVHNEFEFITEAESESAVMRYICEREDVATPTATIPTSATLPIVSSTTTSPTKATLPVVSSTITVPTAATVPVVSSTTTSPTKATLPVVSSTTTSPTKATLPVVSSTTTSPTKATLPVVSSTTPVPTAANEPVPCYETLDLEILLDNSDGVKSADFQLALEYVANLSTAFTVHDWSRVGFITMSEFAPTKIPLINELSPQEFIQAVKSTYVGGFRSPFYAISEALESLDANKRPYIPQAIVVVTYGMSEELGRLVNLVSYATSQSIDMYCVGITNEVYEEELNLLAGNVPENVFLAHNWNDLIPLLSQTSKHFCPKY